jgi:hypothetical protein
MEKGLSICNLLSANSKYFPMQREGTTIYIFSVLAMKKFITNLFKFFLLFLVFVIVPLGFISRFDNQDKQVSNNSNIISLQKKSAFDSLDILFVGNSYCYSSIHPLLFDSVGLKVYNLGIASAGIEFYELVIDDYLAKVKRKPKFIFLLLSPMTFSEKADNYSEYPIHRYLEEPVSNYDIVARFNRYKSFLPLYKKSILKGLQNIFMGNLIYGQVNYENFYLNRGFVPSNNYVDDAVVNSTKHFYASFYTENFDTLKFNNLERVVEKYEVQGCSVVFFEVPTHLLKNYFSRAYYLDYLKGVNTLKRKYEVISISDGLFNSRHFRNIDHMNTNGALLFTIKIIDEIKNRRIF